MGTAIQGSLKAKFKLGAKDYSVGNHPLWELFRAAYQMKRRPFILGGVMIGAGFASSLIKGEEIPLSPALVAFVQEEQMQRLKNLFAGRRNRQKNRDLAIHA
jgi:hypothetical protein